MPDTTCAELGLPSMSEYNTNRVAPAATRALVRRPAIRARHCRSAPISAAQARPTASLVKKSMAAIAYPSRPAPLGSACGPGRVLPRHLDDQRLGRGPGGGPSWPSAGEGPLAGDEVTVPAQGRGRGDREDLRPPAAHQPRRRSRDGQAGCPSPTLKALHIVTTVTARSMHVCRVSWDRLQGLPCRRSSAGLRKEPLMRTKTPTTRSYGSQADRGPPQGDPRFTNRPDSRSPPPPPGRRRWLARLVLAVSLLVLTAGAVLPHGAFLALGLVLAGLSVASLARQNRPPTRKW